MAECWTRDAQPTVRRDERATIHRAHFAGLVADTLYSYRVGSAGAWSAIHQFRTAPSEATAVTFAVYGGTAGSPERHAAVVEALVGRDPAFIVHTGDLAKDDDGLVPEFLVPAHPLLASRAVVPVRGRTEAGSREFARLFPSTSGGGWRRMLYATVEIFALDAVGGLAVSDAQHKWLERALARSEARWKIVVVHPALFDPVPRPGEGELRRVLYPLLLRGGVDLTLSGGGAYTRTHPIGAGETPRHNAIVAITTTAQPSGATPEASWIAHSAAEPHFVVVEANADRLTVTALGLGGKTLDTVELAKHGTLRRHRHALPAEAIEGLLAFHPPGGFEIGGPGAATREFTIVVDNPYDLPIKGTVRWTLADPAWSIQPLTLDLRVAPLGSQRIAFSVIGSPGVPGPVPALLAGEDRFEAKRSPFQVDAAEE